ncbi:MAG TPA: hypothetical protein VIG24_06430 [Acidimicrobiia bacterium]
MARDSQLGWFMSAPVLLFLILVGFIPIGFPLLSRYEGELLPVVRNVQVEVSGTPATGLLVDVSFDKVRACEFLGLSWYDTFGDRLPILFEVEAETMPSTRPVMDGQRAGPWKLLGIDRLDGSVAITSHRCHPLWITYTRFYP